jgi:hypothetical protein
MLHPALARALAADHIEDLHRAAARRHAIRLARRVPHEPRVAATPSAIQRSASVSPASDARSREAGRRPARSAET